MTNLLVIPDFSLVLMIGPAGSGKSTFARNHFSEDQIISSDYCRFRVCGDMESQDYNKHAFNLLRFIVETRLSLGFRVVIDATNLKENDRQEYYKIADKFNAPVVELAIDTTLEKCLAQNAARDRVVPEHVIHKHWAQYEQYNGPATKVRSFGSYTIIPSKDVVAPGWDIIGDIHACPAELITLLRNLGYLDKEGTCINPGRKLAFVGDFVDRGPNNIDVLRVVIRLVDFGLAVAVQGNHDNKLWRTLKGNKTKVGSNLQQTLDELYTDIEKANIIGLFLENLPYQLNLYAEDGAKITVSHAGIPLRYVGRQHKAANAHCLYGESDGVREDGFPNRTYEWREEWERKGTHPLVFGHDVQAETRIATDGLTWNIDDGCVFGGSLTALRFPEMELVSVPAFATYYSRE